MSTYKTPVNHEQAADFFAQHLHAPDLELRQITGGEGAQAYAFESLEGPRILRLTNKGDTGFRKDKLCFDRFHSDIVPIPEVFEIGQTDTGLHFAITERMPGKVIDGFKREEINVLMPALIRTLDAIHATEPFGSGYGKWDLDGKGEHPSWHAKLEADLHLDDEETVSASFYDYELAEKLRKEIRAMIGDMPEIRSSAHYDYGFGNTLSDGQNITGVIDWELASWGDFVHDIAWLDFWDHSQGYAAAFKQYYHDQGRDVPDFDARLRCYKLNIGLGSLGFFARSRQEQAYVDTAGLINQHLIHTF